MPTKLNAYQCNNCQKSFDYLQHGSEDEPVCPDCGSSNVCVLPALGGLCVISVNDHDFNQRQSERLQKRADEHNATSAVRDEIQHKRDEFMRRVKNYVTTQ